MKKLVFAVIAFSSLMVLSCRQQEEMMDSEDLKTLSVLKEATSKISLQIKKVVLDTIINNITAEVSSFSVIESDIDTSKTTKIN